jgi:hypothetical protein
MGREGERIYEERYTPYQRLFCVTVFVFIIASPYGSGKGSRALSFSHSLTLSAMMRILLAHLGKDRMCFL